LRSAATIEGVLAERTEQAASSGRSAEVPNGEPAGWLRRAACTAFVIVVACAMPALAQAPAPRILIDQPLVAVEYQLRRLTNDELARVERKAGDPRYRPVYLALLTRRGLGPDLREEAVAALTKLDGVSRAQAIAGALARLPQDDTATIGALLTMLFAEPPAGFAKERALFAKLAEDPAATQPVLAAAYGAMLMADGNGDVVWPAASGRKQLAALVRALAYMPWRGALAPMASNVAARAATLVEDDDDPAVRSLAMAALAAIRPDAATFRVLAAEIVPSASFEDRDAAIRAIGTLPREVWPADQIEPLARRIIDIVRGVPEAARTEPGVRDAIELGGRLADALPDAAGRAVRRDLRALGVQVVRIAAVREEMRFDRRWFAVQAGRPVEIVLVNPDVMPHNLVVGRPGALEEIGTTGSAMPMPADPAAKPFVPDSPLVLYATTLVGAGEEARLRFTAPKAPGEYPFVCTFPGHWLRMYGVMLVVSDIESWEATPSAPMDPLTKAPFVDR
jgi:azurin